MTKTDKFLYYIVWGGLIGAGVAYGFDYARTWLSGVVVGMLSWMLRHLPGDPDLIVWLANLLHALVAAIAVVLVALGVMFWILKVEAWRFVLVPGAVILALGYGPIWLSGEGLYFFSFESYPAQVLNPLVLVLVFFAMVGLGLRFRRGNKGAPKNGPAVI